MRLALGDVLHRLPVNADIRISGNHGLETMQGGCITLALIVKKSDVKLIAGKVFQALVDVIDGPFGIY